MLMKKIWSEEDVKTAFTLLQELPGADSQLVCHVYPVKGTSFGRMSVAWMFTSAGSLCREVLNADIAAVLEEFLSANGDLHLEMPSQEAARNKIRKALQEVGLSEQDSLSLTNYAWFI